MTEHHVPLFLQPSCCRASRAQPWAIEATVTPQGAPQAAVLGVAITDRWELLFDTVTQSRKHQNLVKNPRVAFVIGWEHERAASAVRRHRRDSDGSGAARRPVPSLRRFPDGPTRQTWPGLVYWRVRPTWIRYSNFNVTPPIIQEWDAAAIAGWLK